MRTELLPLARDPRTGKVDHPPKREGGSKDISDAVAGAVLGAVDVGGAEAEDDGDLPDRDGALPFDVVGGPELPSGAESALRSMLTGY